MLRVEEVFHSYDNKPLLQGIDFSVSDDEVLCLLGPSGSGKSTMLRIIAGLEFPDQGKIFWNNEDITKTPVHLRRFGMVFQDYALFPHMEVFDNVAFGLEMQKMDREQIRQRVMKTLELLSMSDFAHRRVTELSGGEQQRIALARSLAVEPSLLMLDEPLGALDHSLRQSVIDELKWLLGKNGIPAIYVTHDQEEAFALADRVAILHDGVLIQNAAPDDVFRKPANIWCARFLGMTNIVTCFTDDTGKVYIKNFDENVCLAQKSNSKNQNVSVLLNGGHFDSYDEQLTVILKGQVQNSTFRGTYYDVHVTIDDAVIIIVHNSQRMKSGEYIRLGFTEQEICVFTEET